MFGISIWKDVVSPLNTVPAFAGAMAITSPSTTSFAPAGVPAEGNTIVAEVFLDTENDPDCAKRLDADILKLNGILPVFKNIGKTVIRQTEFPKTTTKKIKRQYKKEEKS